MKAQLIAKNQIRAFVSPDEVADRRIDLKTATYHDPRVAALINDVLLTLKDQIDDKIYKMPHRTEVIPLSDGSLILLINWSDEEREFLGDKNTTFTPPPSIPGDPNSSGMPPYALPIDELQASVMADIVSALSTGDLKEHLKKYLNEDFLEELLHAVTASGLEDMLSSFLLGDENGPSGSSETDPADHADKEAQDSVMREQYAKKTAKQAPSCLCVDFKGLSQVEKALEAADLTSFGGESMLFKTGKTYTLVLAPGKMGMKKFKKETSAVHTIYNGEYRPIAHMAYLSEHAKTIIKKNAVKTLLET